MGSSKGSLICLQSATSSLADKLENALLTAYKAGQTSAIVATTMGKAKLLGLLTEKAELLSPDETMKPTTIVLVGEPIPQYEELNCDCS